MSETELPAYLMNLEPEQLEQVRKMLVQRIEDQHQQKLKQRSLPPAFHDLDALAANTGLDLSSLLRDIKRRS
ncbi:hypothetical protein [Marinobacterium iners]|uniref:Uncharacterized protein n=1 Tax=Marinobacterium iners DSM 11526 TaxID=1122198 RepID=A0A1H4AX52_9GAMM|nr:hypothetical protein [Marinobacterium iners]SEA40469.1 hypothetical protein SAMN02745729_10390 [Marinobacterium iners DSM 11526]